MALAVLFEEGEPLAERVPLRFVSRIGVVDLFLTDRAGRASFASDLGGNALPHLCLQMRIDEDGALRLPEEIDEAGGDDVVVRVDRGRCGNLRKIADGDDRVAAHADVAAIPRRAGAVDDAAVCDFQVEHGGFGSGGALCKAEGRKQKAEIGCSATANPKTSAFCLHPSAFHLIPFTRSSYVCRSRIRRTSPPSTITSGGSSRAL